MEKATKASLIELGAKMGIEIAATSTKAVMVSAINERAVELRNVNMATTTANMVLQHQMVVLQQRVAQLETAPSLWVGLCWGAFSCVFGFKRLFHVSRFPFAGSSLPERRCLDFVLRFWSVGPSLLLMLSLIHI